jgi:uncharacterized protein (TIGR01777 family)
MIKIFLCAFHSPGMLPLMRIAVMGGTGFIGPALIRALREQGHSVIALSRDIFRAKEILGDGIDLVHWAAGERPGPWETEITRADAVVNLAGEGIFAKRWDSAYKSRIWSSRVEATRQIVEAMGRQHQRPRILINASAIGFYGPRGDESLDEKSLPGSDFLGQMVQAWEAEALKAEALGLRVVRLRIGVVLEKDGGALLRMVLPFRMFMGGRIGTGRQYISWIHREDLVRIILYALDHDHVHGAVNATAPRPVTNKEFTTVLARTLHRPSWAPVPGLALKLLLGEAADVILTGQHVLPKTITAAGYQFKHPELAAALQSILH